MRTHSVRRELLPPARPDSAITPDTPELHVVGPEAFADLVAPQTRREESPVARSWRRRALLPQIRAGPAGEPDAPGRTHLDMHDYD